MQYKRNDLLIVDKHTLHNLANQLLPGDFLAPDNAALNSWISTWQEENEINYEGAVGLGVRILERFCTWFDHIVLVEGNHDDRINRKTGGEVWFAMLLNEARIRAEAHHCVIEFAHYSYCYLETVRGMVCLIHPVNYSVNPVGLAQQLYATENGPYYDPADPNSRVDRCHIVVAHTHIQAWGWTKDNTRECHALGTLRDPLRTQYKNKNKSKLPSWNQGFLMVKRSYFYPLNRHSTDSSEFLDGLESQRYEIIESQRMNLKTRGRSAAQNSREHADLFACRMSRRAAVPTVYWGTHNEPNQARMALDPLCSSSCHARRSDTCAAQRFGISAACRALDQTDLGVADGDAR